MSDMPYGSTKRSVSRAWGIALACFGASAVLLGAFGAHALRATLSPQSMEVWHTAVEYHFWHVLALAIAVIMIARIARWLFAAGIVLFCGSLYALALGAPHWIGAITPIGGLCLIAGWIALGVTLLRHVE